MKLRTVVAVSIEAIATCQESIQALQSVVSVCSDSQCVAVCSATLYTPNPSLPTTHPVCKTFILYDTKKKK
jgi:hypothetical protein